MSQNACQIHCPCLLSCSTYRGSVQTDEIRGLQKPAAVRQDDRPEHRKTEPHQEAVLACADHVLPLRNDKAANRAHLL
jgi:hypothetical protein